MEEKKPLGAYLKQLRESQALSLRDVQSKTGISNAFLSQIESGKVKEPSPVMLHKLATLYRVPYEHLMKCAGYPGPEPALSVTKTNTTVFQRFGNITQEEEEQLLDYLGFLRSRARRGRR